MNASQWRRYALPALLRSAFWPHLGAVTVAAGCRSGAVLPGALATYEGGRTAITQQHALLRSCV
jgi:hypothetical protein